MFYATRAALFHVGQPERALGKTHSGMIAAFNQFLVRPGIIEASTGRMLQVEFSRRLVADYEAEGVGAAQAIEAIDNARSFLAAVRAII